MNRLLACTAIGLCLGLAPALAEPQTPGNTMPNESGMPATPPQTQAVPNAMAPGPSAAQPTQAVPGRNAAFLKRQESNEWLASNLIGRSVVNNQNETIGDLNDLVTDRDGKVVAALIGVGGFLGIGEKDVAVRFQDLQLARDANNKVKVSLDTSKENLNSAPDYKKLNERQTVEGANKGDREDRTSRTY